MHDDRALIENRLARALQQRIRPALYGATVPLELEVWHAPGEPVAVTEALAAAYEPTSVGTQWGPAWGTSWFRLRGAIPSEWDGERVEAVIDPGFRGGPGFTAEGLVFTADGTPIKGLSPENRFVPLSGLNSGGASGADGAQPAGGTEVELYLEAAANPTLMGQDEWGPTPLGDKATAGTEPMFTFRQADLAVFHQDVWDLILDLETLGGLMRELPVDQPRRQELLQAISRALDALDYTNIPGTAAAARAQLIEVAHRPAYASAHRLSAVGHAHIDTAWLWPLRETVRKIARTMATATTLAADHPDFRFVFSQAIQHEWLKEQYPTIFERVRQAIAKGQIIPVGSQWVEPDGNVPGGEAMIRQLVYGKQFFLREYGVETTEIWLPDSFGYSGAFPQIAREAGINWFLTQKISWNQTNKFPHHTFWWEGLDGTRVFTHFPPIDTYNATLSGPELAHAQRNFAEHGAATRSLVPFGHGDGGGGPTREMLATLNRVADLEGSPKVVQETPREFFTAAQEEYPDAPVWSGELYLELHRGTLTTQAKTKQGNRRGEHLLREAELWSTAAALAGKLDYPYGDLERLWKVTLLNQFHDVLPGSSIAWVYHDAEAMYAKQTAELEAIISRATEALAGPGEQSVVFNAAPHSREGVPALGASVDAEGGGDGVSVRKDQPTGVVVLANGRVEVTVDARGLVTSFRDLATNREVLPPGGTANLLQLHVDTPNLWDAWDVDSFYRNAVTDLDDAEGLEELSVVVDGGAQGAVRVVRTFGASRIVQTIRLRRGARRFDVDNEVDWRESEKLLKVAFPLDVHADRSASEIQFGHVFRPTHTNTSWEAARFEICAHRWLQVGESGYGVALVNDSKYGFDVSRDTRDEGGTTTTVRMSLLRAPLFPDPKADQGVHEFSYGLVAGADIPTAVEEGYRINLPARTVQGGGDVAPVVSVDHPAIVIESVKLADDRSGDVVVRMYEAHGGRASGTVRPGCAVSRAVETDALERTRTVCELVDGGVEVALRPFQLRTLRFTPDG